MPILDRYEQWRFMNTHFLCISYLGFALTTRGNSSIAKMKMGIKRVFFAPGLFFSGAFIHPIQKVLRFFVEFPGNNLFRKRLERVFSIKKSYGLFVPLILQIGCRAFLPFFLLHLGSVYQIANCRACFCVQYSNSTLHLQRATIQNIEDKNFMPQCLGAATK